MLKHLGFRNLLLWLGIALGARGLPAAASTSSDLLDAVQRSGLPQSGLSLYAVQGRGSAARILLLVNAHKPMIPASVTKLVTSATALQEFTPGTRFETVLLSNGETNGSILNGDLVLRGGGDPSFVTETLLLLVQDFARSGIREVRGDIVVDDSYFDEVRIDPSRDPDRVENAYDAPVGAMSFNWNTVTVYIRPGAHIGDPAKVLVEPDCDYIKVSGTIRTVPGRSAAGAILHRAEEPGFFGNVLEVSGTIGVNSAELVTHRNITRPELWSGSNLKLFLKYLGINVTGQVRRGPTPAGSHRLAAVQGRPIEQIVVDMNKVSSNFIAEMLAKNLAARQQQPGTMEAGMQRLRDYLKSLSVDPAEFELLNPSGLTRENRLSAYSLVRVLQDMGNDFQYETEFMASLPIAGVDGTLRKRMRRSPARRWVRAKTGYVDGAITLAGYAGHSDGERTTFAFLYNGGAPGYRVQKLYEELCSILVTE